MSAILESAIIQCFMETDEELIRECIRLKDPSGCTGLLLLLDAFSGKLVCANCGDSQMLLSRARHALILSQLHKPENPSEVHRVLAANTKQLTRFNSNGNTIGNWNVDGGRIFNTEKSQVRIAVSRAFGDFHFKVSVLAPIVSDGLSNPNLLSNTNAHSNPNGSTNLNGLLNGNQAKQVVKYDAYSSPVSVIPYVDSLELKVGTDEFLVLACDGLFDVMSGQDVIDWIERKKTIYWQEITESVKLSKRDRENREKFGLTDGQVGRMATELCEYAVNQKRSKDNISVIIVFLYFNKN